MGVEVLTCGEDIDKAILEKFLPDDRVESIMSPFGYDGTRDNITLPLPACENLSYKHANLLLASGKKLFRNEAGDFTENEGTSVRRSRIGLLKKSATWNEEEGFTRSLLKMYSFDFRIVLDKEIRENGVPQDIDVVIIPGDDDGSLSAGDVRNMKMPIEFHSGLGSAGAAALQKFVNGGGRLVCTVVEPENCRIERIGGAGNEFSLGGVNHPRNEKSLHNGVNPNVNDDEGGWGRITVTALDAQCEEHFLVRFELQNR